MIAFEVDDDSVFKYGDDGEVDVYYEGDNDGTVHDIDDYPRIVDDSN